MSKVLKKLYELAQSAKVGDTIKCPGCCNEYVKQSYQQKFCKKRGGTKCKDKYWNTVTPNKKNNTTRISPASAAWMAEQEDRRERQGYYDEHPFSSGGHGQWDD